ncbi:MAG: two-component sensor histidine kinase [Polyangiaceae bacterium]|nr:two-component sensor histidine kinase [Polyangiaceae bacterium]
MTARAEAHAQERGYQRIIRLLLWLVILPALLLSALGVAMLLRGEAGNILIGILVIIFCVTLATGTILVWVFVRQQKNLSELQIDFVSKVSHELRTPLTSIRMFTETLELRRDDPEAVRVCIDALGRESTRLQGLIDRLLDWGRMESGRRVYDMRPESLGEILDEAVDAFEPSRAGRLVVNKLIQPNLPKLWCDRGAVVDVLVNLLSNAYKYGSKERVDITIEPREKKIAVVVKDYGVGIARHEHKRIFERFYRVDDLLARQQEGSGLGLAIVHHVVRAHKGKVTVDSEPGKGSAFTLLFPTGAPKHAKGAVLVSDRAVQSAEQQ